MERLQTLIKTVKPCYADSNDPAHDWPHVGRVAASARTIGEKENANIEILLAAVYCHDLINLPKDHPDRKNASTITALEAQKHLSSAGFAEHEISKIKDAIIEHSFSKGLKPTSLESAILQDADRLDAIGAIGVLRCAAVNVQMNGSFYEPQDPLAERRDLDDKKFMVDHYFVKLFRLPELMNTSSGKEEAKRRVDYMKDFLKKLLSETRNV